MEKDYRVMTRIHGVITCSDLMTIKEARDTLWLIENSDDLGQSWIEKCKPIS